MDILESAIERSYVNWLRNEYIYEAAALKLILFSGRGFPDRTILTKGKVYFIEFKARGATLSAHQLKWKTTLERLGFSYYICSTLQQAQQITYDNLDSP